MEPMTKEISNISTEPIAFYDSTTVVLVTDADQLFDMDEERYYLLMNDLDLSGYTVDNFGDFVGYFDGNGYSIKNYTVNKILPNGVYFFGLFESSRGGVRDLHIADVSVTLYGSGDNVTVLYGGFSGHLSGDGIFDGSLSCSNVTLSGTITVVNATADVSMTSQGYDDGDPNGSPSLLYGDHYNCINYADISVQKGSITIPTFSETVTKNCKNYGNLFCESGIINVGFCENFGTVTVQNDLY